MNKYPIWKNAIIVLALLLGLLYAAPNLYAPDPAVQVTGQSSSLIIEKSDLKSVERVLQERDINIKSAVLEDNKILVRLVNREDQHKTKTIIQNLLGIDNYVVALNLAPTTPDWLLSIGASPLKLGLDLSGGVHFLMAVDTEAAIETRLLSMVSGYKTELRKEKVRGSVRFRNGEITGTFKTAELRDQASSIAADLYPELLRRKTSQGDRYQLILSLGEQGIAKLEDEAVSQNLTTLRNRVNELGVSEPIVQRQGRSRIVVELPGVQDTAEAKKILGKTANLQFRLHAKADAPDYATEAFEFEGRRVLLESDVIVTGEGVSGASSGFDENSQPQVNIELDAASGQLMHKITRHAIKRRMAVIFVERKTRKIGTEVNELGERVPVYEEYDDRRIISLATIQSALSSSFRITGLDSQQEASELALLLRAGALAAPMRFAEERTIGPSLGEENINAGITSIIIGMSLVVVFMLAFYRVFGIAANLALTMNIILMVAIMSIFGATLTLPGIAGVVLTVGMAVDANVLIFSRIREELRNGSRIQTAINSGFDRAFVTIRDANLTTLLAAVILYGVGTGPIKGFAVTLMIGIVTSMFTAIMGTRAIVNGIYGGRNVKKLSI